MPEPRELQEFLSWEPEPLQAIIGKGLMYQGSRCILYGRYKSLKSMLAIWLGLAASRGEQWLGFDTPSMGCSVLYLQLELPEPMLQKRIKKMLQGVNETKKDFWLWSEYSLKLDDRVGWERLRGYLEKHRPELLIIDPVYKVMKGNILDARQVQDLLDAIDRLNEHFPTMATLLVSHTRKKTDNESGGSDDLIGSMLFSAWADSVIRVERNAWAGINVYFDIIRHAEEELTPRAFSFNETTMQFSPAVTLGDKN